MPAHWRPASQGKFENLKMKSICLSFVLLVSYILFSSHEFWLQPEKFLYKRGELINIRFHVGENFNGENWNGNIDRVENLRFYFGNVIDKDLDKTLSAKEGDSLQLAMGDEGTIMITYQSKNSFIQLEAEKFNEYLREDGLTEALEYREQHNDTAKAGKEFYQRSIKTILQVGKKTDHTYKQKTGLPVDIIPDDHPYTVAKDDDGFKVKILFRGEPMKKARVKVWHKVNEKVSQTEYITDNDGDIKFFLTPTGQWMISTIKIIHLDNDPKAEWQSYWGTLTWGYY